MIFFTEVIRIARVNGREAPSVDNVYGILETVRKDIISRGMNLNVELPVEVRRQLLGADFDDLKYCLQMIVSLSQNNFDGLALNKMLRVLGYILLRVDNPICSRFRDCINYCLGRLRQQEEVLHINLRRDRGLLSLDDKELQPDMISLMLFFIPMALPTINDERNRHIEDAFFTVDEQESSVIFRILLRLMCEPSTANICLYAADNYNVNVGPYNKAEKDNDEELRAYRLRVKGLCLDFIMRFSSVKFERGAVLTVGDLEQLLFVLESLAPQGPWQRADFVLDLFAVKVLSPQDGNVIPIPFAIEQRLTAEVERIGGRLILPALTDGLKAPSKAFGLFGGASGVFPASCVSESPSCGP